jgi:hypothetical protein
MPPMHRASRENVQQYFLQMLTAAVPLLTRDILHSRSSLSADVTDSLFPEGTGVASSIQAPASAVRQLDTSATVHRLRQRRGDARLHPPLPSAPHAKWSRCQTRCKSSATTSTARRSPAIAHTRVSRRRTTTLMPPWMPSGKNSANASSLSHRRLCGDQRQRPRPQPHHFGVPGSTVLVDTPPVASFPGLGVFVHACGVSVQRRIGICTYFCCSSIITNITDCIGCTCLVLQAKFNCIYFTANQIATISRLQSNIAIPAARQFDCNIQWN